ncbi:Tfp pilus assembly protein FimT/FimU [Roseateles saccharophilus]|uniref:Type II secretion system protein H n=1 Tax=Roseateles saccharophilus TaxID=304 RepID=A0A4R3UTM8_ROSSA|nr:GspH/FimT family pseudopilin [Roseateles saccharophilus]MDG0832690.1 type II secretion system protein GspH [Roseateles saccharophilus]TCU95376.1 type IV fimbrial biogenesis protein FimT [Roseateles saccharophilus]
MHRAHSSGFSLIELMVVVAVLAIVAAVASPSISSILARRRMEGVARELNVDLQYARSQAATDNVSVTFSTTTDGTAYSITGNQTYKTVTLPSGITVTSGVSLVFDSLRGCVTTSCTGNDTTIGMSSTATSGTLQSTVNALGRVSMCSPSGSFGGYPSC